jgi:hypothetical protein
VTACGEIRDWEHIIAAHADTRPHSLIRVPFLQCVTPTSSPKKCTSWTKRPTHVDGSPTHRHSLASGGAQPGPCLTPWAPPSHHWRTAAHCRAANTNTHSTRSAAPLHTKEYQQQHNATHKHATRSRCSGLLYLRQAHARTSHGMKTSSYLEVAVNEPVVVDKPHAAQNASDDLPSGNVAGAVEHPTVGDDPPDQDAYGLASTTAGIFIFSYT